MTLGWVVLNPEYKRKGFVCILSSLCINYLLLLWNLILVLEQNEELSLCGPVVLTFWKVTLTRGISYCYGMPLNIITFLKP